MPTTGATLLIDFLESTGTKYIFTLSGNQIMPIFDAAIGRNLSLIHTRHEAAAVHMADAWGRLTEQPGVALLTAGPGHANAVSGLYVAQMAESPLVMLSGHAPLSQLGRGAFQEMDQVAMVKPVTKAAWLVEDTANVPADLAKAFDLAQSRRPGPVHLSLPADVLTASVTQTANTPNQILEDVAPLDQNAVDTILSDLSTAERPIILTGPAMTRPSRWSAVARFAELIGIPALPIDSPRGVNDPWLHMATNCLVEADVVLLIGRKLDFSLRFGQAPFFAEGCRFIQIDSEESLLQDEGRVDLAIHHDLTQIMTQLTDAAQDKNWPRTDWSARVASTRQTVPADWPELRQSDQQPIHPLRVCQSVQPFLDQGTIFISDGGEFGQWVQAGLEAKTRLINGPSGSIGSALPMGLAAKAAHPERPVFVLLGDGTVGFHAMEFDTAVRYNLPVIVVVGNDARWNAEYQIQQRDYGPNRTIGCELLPTRYDQLAQALGGYGELVENPADLTPALERALASGLPACINVMIEGVAAPTFCP